MKVFSWKIISTFYIACLGVGGGYIFAKTLSLNTDYLQRFLAHQRASQFYLSSSSPYRKLNSDGNNVYSQAFSASPSLKPSKNQAFIEKHYSELTEPQQIALQNSHEYKSIWDYTVKLSMPCQNGTGWILDFEIPKDGTYPTKWFYATNLHVINNFDFQNNDFSVDLPVLPGQVKPQCAASSDPSFAGSTPVINIYKEHQETVVKYIYADSGLSSRALGRGFTESFQLTSTQGAQPQIQPHLTTKVSVLATSVADPKLFYAAINFLGKRYSNKNNKVIVDDWYHKDFGILEINYPSEQHAKAMTGDFYNRYVKVEDPKDKEAGKLIDIFAPELMAGKTHKELLNLGPFYVGGYPGNANVGLSFEINAAIKNGVDNKGQHTTSRLIATNYDAQTSDFELQLMNKFQQPIAGHVDLLKLDEYHKVGILKWGNKKLRNWGYAYSIDNAFLKAGASGSLVVDGQQRLLGLYRMYNNYYNHAYVEAIRSDGLFEDGKIIYPKYDLITGVEGQVSSYKSQLDRFYPNINTYLRSFNWGNGKTASHPASD